MTQLLLCVDFEYLTDEQIHHAKQLSYKVGQLLSALIRSLRIKSEQIE